MSHDEGTIQLLARILGGAPKLPGAPCKGNPDLFDPAAAHEDRAAVVRRHEAAARLCRFTCPALAECTAWADDLTPRQRPAGVVAGRRPNLPATPGRPRKDHAA